MAEFVREGTVKADPETVFDVYLDHVGYADLIPLIRSAELEKEGEPPPNGLGAIRKLHLPGATVREQVTGYDRPHRYSYKMLSGGPFKKFEATVSFTAAEEGTAVSYAVTVAGSVRGLPVTWPSEEAIDLFMKKAAAQAEHNAQAARSATQMQAVPRIEPPDRHGTSPDPSRLGRD